MRVIGTAGHVDHGKSTLVQALTGIDPDRLKEEKSRGMTIDLGFAWFDLVVPPHNTPEQIGIVDVPGHIDFIKNMLAGIGGIDAALLVIAADEGVMPQTREHLDILDLIAVPSVIVALTKTDLVDEDEWLDLVELDIDELLEGTRYAEAPVVRLSPISGFGMDGLKVTLIEALARLPMRRNRERPRLPIDRVFSLSGFGSIVTGTLSDGHFDVGDAVDILPSGISARIRGLQTHQQQVQRGEPGSRLAINLSGVGTEDLSRGSVVVKPGTHEATDLIDVSFRLLPTASKPMRHNDVISFFTGATESPANIRLLGADQLDPGENGWLQLRLERPVVVASGDRYILRQPSPSKTLGGGVVVDAHPGRRWRRYDDRVLKRLATLSAGTPDEILLDTLDRQAFQSEAELVANSGLDVADAEKAIAELVRSGAILELHTGPRPALLTTSQRDQMTRHTVELCAEYHTEYPLRRGIPKGELRSRLNDRSDGKMDIKAFKALIELAEVEDNVQANDNSVWLPSFQITLTEDQLQRVNQLMRTLQQAGASPPNQDDLISILGGDERLLEMLVEEGRIIRVGDGIVYRSEDFVQLTNDVSEYIEDHGSITLAEARDLLNTSRRYAQALLEELDARSITRREGDVRVLRK